MNAAAEWRGSVLLIVAVVAGCQPSGLVAPSSSSAIHTSTSQPPGSTAGGSLPVGSAPASSGPVATLKFDVQTYPVRDGSHPHDVAPASDGGVWYTGQAVGVLGWLDPATGNVVETPLGGGSAPHGVVSGPDGAAWVTDQGLDAIVRVTPGDFKVTVFPMPANARGKAVHTAAFDHDGILWFTGQRGIVARLNPSTGQIDAFETPRGGGPYGIAVTPSNDVYFVSLEASYLGRVDRATGAVTVIEPPTANAGTRRVWSDSTGRLWVSYWNTGMLALYDPATNAWREWDLPGDANRAYAIYVDEHDIVWLSDFGQNSIVRFDPASEAFLRFESTMANANVRQLLGRPGEAWGAESGVDRLVVLRSSP